MPEGKEERKSFLFERMFTEMKAREQREKRLDDKASKLKAEKAKIEAAKRKAIRQKRLDARDRKAKIQALCNFALTSVKKALKSDDYGLNIEKMTK